MALSYSFHLSNRKNAVSTINKINQTDRHNLRKYEEKKHGEIERLAGGDSVLEDVKKIYHEEFDEALQNYNEGRRSDRQIGDYLKHVSDSRADAAAEIIVQIGDRDFWHDIPQFCRSQITPIFEEQLRRLGELVPEFKVASAVVHYDEASPHMHIVGVPVATDYKKGMEKQVAKTKVFTAERLSFLQEEMRKGLESEMRKYPAIFNDKTLKEKEAGRNKDLPKELLDEYYSTRQTANELANASRRLSDPNRTEPVEVGGKEYIPVPELVRRSQSLQNEIGVLEAEIEKNKGILERLQAEMRRFVDEVTDMFRKMHDKFRRGIRERQEHIVEGAREGFTQDYTFAPFDERIKAAYRDANMRAADHDRDEALEQIKATKNKELGD